MNIAIAELGVILAALGLSLLATAYWIWMLVDAIRQPDGAYRTGTRLVWVIVIALTGWIGAGVYHAVGRPQPGIA